MQLVHSSVQKALPGTRNDYAKSEMPSYEHLITESSIGDTLTLGRSLKRLWLIVVGQTDHPLWVKDTCSLL